MKIIELKSENVKRLEAVAIRPEGNVVEITGKNEAGKSSVLDSILYAFSGRDIESKPIREGQEKASIEVDCGDFTVKRTITPKNKTLRIETKEGDQKKSPQAFLNEVVGRISFDPLEFIRKKPIDQKQIMMELVPQSKEIVKAKVDADELRKKTKQLRKDGKARTEKFREMPYHEDAPTEEPRAAFVIEKLKSINEKESEASRLEEERRQAWEAKQRLNNDRADAEIALKAAKERLEGLFYTIAENEKHLKSLGEKIAALPDYEKEKKDATARLQSIESDRKKWEENQARNKEKKEMEEMSREYKQMKADAEAKAEEAARIEKSAEFPVDGMSFDDNGLLFNGIPTDQLSQAQKIKVGMAVSMAMNPKLRVILCREASLLDETNLEVVKEVAKEKDFQIWMERVSSTGKTGIVISEGAVKNGQ